jgi:hypothetical protein
LPVVHLPINHNGNRILQKGQTGNIINYELVPSSVKAYVPHTSQSNEILSWVELIDGDQDIA